MLDGIRVPAVEPALRMHMDCVCGLMGRKDEELQFGQGKQQYIPSSLGSSLPYLWVGLRPSHSHL